MKNFLKLLTVLVLAAISTACGSDKDPEDGPNYHRNAMYTMRLCLAGDYVEESDAPLTRFMDPVPGNTFYGVNVRRKESGSSSMGYYAYGVFNDPTQMRINVYSGDTYEFEVTVLRNNTDILQLDGGNIQRPFRVGTNTNDDNALSYHAEDLNKFVYKNNTHLAALNVGTALVKSNRDDQDGRAMGHFMYPRVHRYYGKLEGYSYSSSEPQNIYIPLTYESFGLKVTATSIPEGSSLTWTHENVTDRTKGLWFSSDAKFVYDENKDGSEGYVWEDIYSLNSFSNSSKSVDLKFTLTLPGNITKTFSKSVTVTRGRLKTLNVVIGGNVDSTGTLITVSELSDSLDGEDPENVNVNF